MLKTEAFALLAPNHTGPDAIHIVASACRISYQAVYKWPDNLSDATSDRVIAAYHRVKRGEPLGKTRRSNTVPNPYRTP